MTETETEMTEINTNIENEMIGDTEMAETETETEITETVNEENMPEEFRCPISLDLMKEPVIAADGHSYDKTQIERWFQTNDTSPKTRDSLLCKNLFPNLELRNRINAWLVENGKDPLLPYDPNPSNNIERSNPTTRDRRSFGVRRPFDWTRAPQDIRNDVNNIINRTINAIEENDIENYLYNNTEQSQNNYHWRTPSVSRGGITQLLARTRTRARARERDEVRTYWNRDLLDHHGRREREQDARLAAQAATIRAAAQEVEPDGERWMRRGPGQWRLGMARDSNEEDEADFHRTEAQHFENQFDEWWNTQRFERGWTSRRILCNACGRMNTLRFGCRFCNAPLRLSRSSRNANNIQHLYSRLMDSGHQIGNHNSNSNDLNTNQANASDASDASEIARVQNEIRILGEEITNINSELEAVRTLAGNFSSQNVVSDE
tara:strand:+ start:1986 stop:3290 length:1305 start_codon:yes stop_codon:yes gene_type:complete